MIARLRSLAAVGAAALVTTCAIGGGSAEANAPISAFSVVPSTRQAGGHPDTLIVFKIKNHILQRSTNPCGCEDAKDVHIHLPAGFIGNPHAAPQCSLAEFSADSCPIDSQVGIVHVKLTNLADFNAAVYNLEPPPDVAGLTGFKTLVFNTPIFTTLSSRTDSDYGLDATALSLFHGFLGTAVESVETDLWGVPAESSHDPMRLNPEDNPNTKGTTAYVGGFCNANDEPSTIDPNTVVQPCNKSLPSVASNSPLTPYLQNPTTCVGGLTSSMDELAYDGTTEHAEYPWPKAIGCDQLSFNPSLYAQPTTDETDTPSGIDVNLSVPQQLSPTIPSPTELRGATVRLPAGFSINPSAADGKTACTDAEANFGTTLAAECPEFSKVGSLEIDSSALPGPLPGFVYLGQPLPGNRYRIFLVADGFATHVKLAGTVTPDPATGQLTITFSDLPQSPLSAFDMHFFGSERALLATPTRCGTYPVTTTFTPWDETIGTQTSTQYFDLTSGPLGSPCPGEKRPFAPDVQASSAGNAAGAHAPFTLKLIRQDGDQNLTALNVTTPPGFSATLAGIPYCPDAALASAQSASYSGLAEQASPSCPLTSQVGSAISGAGSGNHPVYVSGRVYLAGPYNGAPLSLAVITPAVSGPYDLGNVVTRVALHLNPETAQVTAISDPLPQILEGIPLRLRSIRFNLDRPGFTLNPTNCAPLSVAADAFGSEGANAALTRPFQVANCGSLPFEPRVSLRLSGGLNRRGHPAIHATVETQPGEANPKSLTVTLPKGELLDNSHIRDVCSRVAFNAGGCPAGSIVGHAEVTTPLLDQPLSGPVYLRASGQGLPDLALDLNGQFHFVAIGNIDSVHEAYRTRFLTVPDVPLGTVKLDLLGGKKGLLQNSEGLCGTRKRAAATITAQSGRVTRSHPALSFRCSRTKKRSKRGRNRASTTHDRRSSDR